MNKVTLIGHLGAEPEYKTTTSGLAITNLRVATNEKTKDGTQTTEWHSVVLFGKGAEMARAYKKGIEVFVEGKLKTDMYEKNGEKRYTTKINAFLCKPFLKAENTQSDAFSPQIVPEHRKPQTVDTEIPF